MHLIIALDPETQAFAQGHNETLSIQLKENEHDYLNSMQGQSSDEDEDDEPRISRYEAERMMSEAARKRSSVRFFFLFEFIRTDLCCRENLLNRSFILVENQVHRCQF